jgi:3D (Asp-Asp-Asp) domain-containing protein|tara:strand:+ start:342 stop:926 length:585 start_codon:yes stop_codon:yes gene_type:complete
MIKNIALVVMSVMFVAYGIERHYYINNVEDQIMGMYAKEAVKDSLMKDSTIRALQLVEYLDDCGRKVVDFKKKINDQEANKIKVTVTMYHPVPEQTDSTPNITADGTVFRIENASDYRYIAVAQNMLVRNGGFLDYGDWVVVDAGKKSGLYQVRDTMAKRWINRIDILETPGVIPYKYNNASLRKLVYKSGELN